VSPAGLGLEGLDIRPADESPVGDLKRTQTASLEKTGDGLPGHAANPGSFRLRHPIFGSDLSWG